jgi:GAF domain-containing protein
LTTSHVTAPVPEAVTNPRRVDALRRQELLDTPPEEEFDRLTRLASRLIGLPVALVSLVDADRQFFKSCFGLPEPWASRRETSLSYSFCQHAVAGREPLIVADAREDAVLRENLAVREMGVVAYAGIPLMDPGGSALGTLCVLDS